MRKMKLLILSLMALSSLCFSKNDNNIEAEAGNITSSISQINVEHSEAVSTMDVTANREWMVDSNDNWVTRTPTGTVTTTARVTVTIATKTTTEGRVGS